MPTVERRPELRRRLIAEGVVALLMLVLAFVAIAASDVSAAGTHFFWSILVLAFAAVTLAADRLYAGHGLGNTRSALAIALHWIGVMVAIQCVYFLVSTGRMANADTGLTSGLILALGTFAAGAYGNWRLLVIGAALFMAAAGVAFVEEYVWVLLAVAALAIVVLVLGSRLTWGRGSGRDAGA